MTAKESFESLVFNYAPVDDREFRGHLERFAAQLCQEQRELCRDNVDTAERFGDAPDYNIVWNSILNAPIPEL